MSMNADLVALGEADVRALRADPEQIAQWMHAVGTPGSLSLQKMWHALHYLLTGTAWNNQGPLGQALLGGEDIGPDIGYGPARILIASQVKETSRALLALSAADIRQRFAPEVMEAEDIYPSRIWVREKDTILDELVPLFEELVEFYESAATKDQSILLFMT
ncbi:MAG: DUF1877 family protein [Alphaproteobacteria bacterium]|nr:DUF1877 family protein [Alphaproteobacteria bacterium]